MSALKTNQTHSLKTWPDPFAALERGEKSFEFRKNDRDYMVGDQLVLNEWNPLTGDYTERILYRTVTYIVRGPAFGVPDGYCVMSLAAPEAARSLSAEDVEKVRETLQELLGSMTVRHDSYIGGLVQEALAILDRAGKP